MGWTLQISPYDRMNMMTCCLYLYMYFFIIIIFFSLAFYWRLRWELPPQSQLLQPGACSWDRYCLWRATSQLLTTQFDPVYCSNCFFSMMHSINKKNKASLYTSLPPPDRLPSADPAIPQQADALRDACCDDSRFGRNLWNHDGSLHLLWGEGDAWGGGRKRGDLSVHQAAPLEPPGKTKRGGQRGRN